MAALVDSSSDRQRPNILVTGTPGTGKTTLTESICDRLGFTNINVGELVKTHECYERKDEEMDTYILDEDKEDKLLDLMEPMLQKGGCVVDFHSPELFPERWFDLVLVLRTDTEVLFDRLSLRGYSEKKRMENMECEIMQVVAEEAREAYESEIVHEIMSNTVEDIDSGAERVELWLAAFKKNQVSP
jgi:adenylate kinase